MDTKMMNYLKSHKKIMVSLSELENLFSGETDYKEIVDQIELLVSKGILQPIHSHGTNLKQTPLFNTYKIIKKNLMGQLNDEIQQYSLLLHPKIQLNEYFSLSEAVWKRDLPYIQKIDQYLKEKGLPENEAFAPERSVQLVSDEKWIDEKGGKTLLERIGIWDLCKINSVPEPLMLAINPSQFLHQEHRHLIVENKTTYYLLAEILQETSFTSLIYGAGWKIVSNIQLAAKQLGLESKSHKFYYFGDIDMEGISIWYNLRERFSMEPALPFYKSLLQKASSIGKETQYRNEEAFASFLQYFSQDEQHNLTTLFHEKRYYPQELLNKAELQNIWRNLHGSYC
ncbi:MAG: hypothetical protein K0R93_3158 [Anaerosolibacter sp.]|jgi:hypothetical protein|uniref:Wadjet anti-phage system protein JetD domain-containing protein n=1 Tax=Anaerosolibacter sp. TaxID=1872527 RepID=UPI0026141D88|nr:Wadjet anti-phage system protein JetD domain-containing protein [Anaerosolibacter sp.]MDF2548260.1 hypothetical protein [Anaerosolibacter sp.]